MIVEGGADCDLLACATGRTNASLRRLVERSPGGGWGAAGEGRRRGGERGGNHRARLRPLSISLTCAHAEYA
jgi:hypothetical protein